MKNMKVTVYHNESLFARNNDEKVVFTRVAVVEAPMDDVMEALEYAYRWTNNVMGSWSRTDIEDNGDFNPNVTRVASLCEGGYGLRSTSVGDVMFTEDGKYEVAPMGFKKCEEMEDVA
jgi:hypothetical protein